MSRIERLDWDSDFFGIQIARHIDTHLNAESWDLARQECLDAHVKCLYMLADSNDLTTSLTLEANGFHYADTRLTYECELSPTEWPENVRPATAADIERLVLLARESHIDSRFFFDPGFEIERCKDLYETWLKNSLSGFADATLVAEVDHQPVAYVTLHRRNNHGQIGIIAVDQSARGQGIGRKLIQAAHAQYQIWELTHAQVVTQLRNLAAQRLYQAHGYRVSDASHWYHRWF
jgi:dTDP-4-amino-4,6-dideoxy-D-galactose acyltransferase